MTNSYKDVLNKMIEEPGMISEAFSQFHNYSFGNLMMVAFECAVRGIEFGPVSNYNNWKRLGRQVRKGESGIIILHPVERSFTKTEIDENGEEVEKVVKFMAFVPKATAFVMSQTDGDDIEWSKFGWDKEQALKELEIKELPFDHLDGNAQGFANKEGVSVNPVAKYPMKTMAHEIAHKIMHIRDDMTIVDFIKRDYSAGEVEAETVALIVSEALGLPGRQESIGYIRRWMDEGFEYTDKQANAILSTANKILKAGKVEIEAEEVVELIKHDYEYTPEDEVGMENPTSTSVTPDDAQKIADQVMGYFEIGKHQLKFDVRVKDVKSGKANYRNGWISIPTWAFEMGDAFAQYYVAHEVCHMVHRYLYIHGIPMMVNGRKEIPHREPGGHGPQFKQLEGEVCKALWGFEMVYKKAYPKQLVKDGEVLYDERKQK